MVDKMKSSLDAFFGNKFIRLAIMIVLVDHAYSALTDLAAGLMIGVSSLG